MKKELKRVLLVVLSFAVCAMMAFGCTTQPAASNDAGSDDTSQEDKKAILVVSFGTSFDDSREITIGAIENAIADSFPDYEIRRAFTSEIIKEILAERDIDVDDVKQAMDSLVDEGFTEVIVQPTHVMSGFEYDDTIEEITPYASKFESFKVGSPLLTSEKDYDSVLNALVEETADFDTEGTALVFMGHGTEHDANITYSKLQDLFFEKDYSNYIIGTVEEEPDFETVLEEVKSIGATKVVLFPLMIVSGDHANNDMAGDEDDSWKSMLEAEGFEVESVLKGLGEYPGVQSLFVEHVRAAEAL